MSYSIFITHCGICEVRQLFSLKKTASFELENASNKRTVSVLQKFQKHFSFTIFYLCQNTDYRRKKIFSTSFVIIIFCYRFWSLYDPVNSGIINYKDFLMKLGTHTESYRRTVPMRSKPHQYSSPNTTRYSR